VTAPPGSWCCRTVELAVRVLPAEHRARYGLEFIAELYGLPPAQQRRHAARVLTGAWALRTALSEAVPGAHGEKAVIIKTATPVTCRLIGRGHGGPRGRSDTAAPRPAQWSPDRRP
jgi:hypothetical protein